MCVIEVGLINWQLTSLLTTGLGLFGATLLAAPAALADDITGAIQSVDTASQSFVLQGITIYTTPTPDYQDGLRGFSDLKPGQQVDVDLKIRDGKHYQDLRKNI